MPYPHDHVSGILRWRGVNVFAVSALTLVLSGPAQGAEAEYAPPPRTVEDILLVLEQYKPDPSVVEQRIRAATREPPATNDRDELAEFYLQRGNARGGLGQVSHQLEDLRLAAQYSRGSTRGFESGVIQQKADRARILYQLAQAEGGGGNFFNALGAMQELVEGIQGEKRPRAGMLLSGFNGLTNMNANLGDIATAKDYHQKAERVLARLQKSEVWAEFGTVWTADIENAKASVFLSEGKYSAAEASFRKVVQLLDQERAHVLALFRQGRRAPNPGQYLAGRNGNEMRLAWTMAQQGRLAEAEAATRNALVSNLSFFGRYAQPSSNGLLSLSRIIFEQGRYREAGLLAAAAVDGLEQSGAAPESQLLTEARKALGAALVAQGDWRGALPVYERIQANLAKDPLVLRQFGKGDINWAYALVKTGQASQAVAMLEELLDTLRKRLGDEDLSVAELRGYLGIALAARGERQRALAEFQRAVPVLLDAARSDQASESGGIARWMRLINILEAYIGLLTDLHQAGVRVAGVDPVAEAFRLADVARGSNVQRALTASAARASIRDPQLSELARREQDAQQRIGVLSHHLSRLLAAPPEQQLTKIIGDIRRDLDNLRKERTALRRELERSFPDYADLTEPRPVTLAQVQAALRPGEALIAIYASAERSYIWALPHSGKVSFSVTQLGQAQIAGTVAALRQALDLGEISFARFPKFDLKRAYELYAGILKPVEAGWKDAKSLLIVPHGALGQLPFALLALEPHELKADAEPLFAGYREAPWLIRRAALTQLPSVNTLITLRRAVQPSPGRREFIGFGDPFFSKEQAAAAAKEQAVAAAKEQPVLLAASIGGLRLRNLSIGTVQTTTTLEVVADAEAPAPAVRPPAVRNSARLAQLARLPDTAEEILEIAQTLRADPREDVYLHERASETILKKLDLSKRRVVAFATHGLVPGDLNGLGQPALALSAPEVVGGEDDGLLTMEEILALKLDADWVVLSACNTASGHGAGSEAVSGLGKAFFYAGARALLVSNWPVETVSARALTTDLFRRQAEDPALERAEALRQTMLALMNGQSASGPTAFAYAHPMFWAPFSLVGDGAGR